MSSPGQIAEPRERPMSGMSATGIPLASPSGPSQPFKNFGQDYQFAETWDNPPPELVVNSAQPFAGEGVSQADGAQENGHNEESSRESYRKEAAVWVPPPEAPWYKKITFMQWAVSSICTVGITAVILAILGAMGKLGPQPPPDVSTTTTSSSAILSTPTGTSTTLSQPTSTTVIKDCTNPSSFHNDIEWVGADFGYKAAFPTANSAGDCCTRCFSGGPGCAGWLYNGTNGFTPCTTIMINADHPGPDSKCPQGYSSVISMSTGGDGVAGIGPCSQGINAG